VIDSLGPACGTELENAGTAINFFAALRILRVSPLIIAHVTKNEGRENAPCSVFGSSFFSNLTRAIWEVRASRWPGTSDRGVSLHHRKGNNSRLYPPVAFHFGFANGGIQVRRQDVSTDAQLASGLSQPDRVLAALKHGKLSTGDLATEIDAPEDSTRKAAGRLEKRGLIRKFPDGWALVARESETE